MAVQEVVSTSWFGRIGGALKGILFGFVLVAVGLIGLVVNECNAVDDIKANKEIAAEVVTVSNADVDPSKEGKLVHLNGPVVTDDIVKNEEFGVEENAIRLSWNAQIYQWVENQKTETRKKLGGGEEKVTTYSYQKKWVDAPVDSSRFKEKGHDNPGGRNFQSGSSQAVRVTLGDFSLPDGLIAKIKSAQVYPLETLPEDLQSEGALVQGGVFFTGSSFASPQVGDEKLSFSLTRPGDVSVMARQSGDSFVPYETEVGKEKFLLAEGILTADEMVKQEEKKAAMLRWGLRFGGLLFLFFGFVLILRPLSVLADVVPIFGSLVGGATALVSLLLAAGIGLLVIAISWVFFRPLIGIPLLVVGVGCLVFVVVKLVKDKKKVAGPPPMRMA